MSYPSFAAGDILNASDMNGVGLWKIAETTFTNSANPFINGCFSSNYENYLVKIFAQSSTSSNVYFRVRYGTNTTENGAVYDRFGFSFAGTISSLISANQTDGYLADITNIGNNQTATDLQMFGPNKTIPTIATSYSWGSGSGSVFFPAYRIETNTAYTGIELFPLSGTLTGTMRVYGYRN